MPMTVRMMMKMRMKMKSHEEADDDEGDFSSMAIPNSENQVGEKPR